MKDEVGVGVQVGVVEVGVGVGVGVLDGVEVDWGVEATKLAAALELSATGVEELGSAEGVGVALLDPAKRLPNKPPMLRSRPSEADTETPGALALVEVVYEMGKAY